MAETELKRVEDTRKFLRVLSGLVAFAAAVMTENPASIIAAVNDIRKTVESATG